MKYLTKYIISFRDVLKRIKYILLILKSLRII